jgi:hypothetical protein
VSGYLGRVATQLAGGGIAPRPTLRTSSPIASHDQLPMVDGLEGAPPPALNDVQSFDAPADDSVTMPRSAVDGDAIPSEQDQGPEPRPRSLVDLEVDREPARERDDARGERHVAADTVPPSVAAPIAKRAIARPHAPPSVETSASHRPTSAMDLMQVLGRVSQDIAAANRMVVQPDPPRAREPDLQLPETARSSPSQLTPSPTRESEVALPTPMPEAPAAPTVQIGELRIEVVEDAPRHVTRRSKRHAQTAPVPGRGPIDARPSKRRFAAGRG